MAKSNSLNSLTFRGVRFGKDALVIINKEATPSYCNLKFRCDLTKPVMEAMGWSVGEGNSGGDLIGKLVGSHFVLTPSSASLKQRELQLEASQIENFKFSGVPNKDGAITSYELTFVARSNDRDAPTKVMEYIHAVGSEKAQLKLSYQLEPVQEALPGTETGKEPEGE